MNGPFSDFTNEPILIENIPDFEQPALKPLDKGYLTIMYISNLLQLVLPIAWIVLIPMFFPEIPSFWSKMGLILILAFILVQFLIIRWSFGVKGYAIREKDIIYQTGLFFRSKTIIPFARVQHGEITRSLLSRAFGLSTLNVYTAGGSSSDLSIPGIRAEEAEKLCAFILQKVNQEMKDEEE